MYLEGLWVEENELINILDRNSKDMFLLYINWFRKFMEYYIYGWLGFMIELMKLIKLVEFFYWILLCWGYMLWNF